MDVIIPKQGVQSPVLLTDVNGNPLTSLGGSGNGSGLSDTILTDDSSAFFLARDNGSTISFVTLAGVAYTPSTNIRPAESVSLAALHADNGAAGTGISQPTGGSGILGFLSGLFSRAPALGSNTMANSVPVTLASDGPLVTATGSTTDAAVTTDSNGTISAKLRGLVKILSSVWDSGSGSLIVRGMTMVGSAVSNYPIGVAAKDPSGNKAHITVDSAGNTNVNPGMVGGACVSIQTQATGANWSMFGSQAARQLTIVNNTSVSIDITDASNVSAGIYAGNNFITVQAGSVMPLFGLTNANGIAVRRNDQSATQVYVQARAEY